MKESILVIDTGSSSMRGILFDLSGNILYAKRIPYTMAVDQDGSAVMDALFFRNCLVTICSSTAEEIKLHGYTLLAISLDSQRSSVLAVDAQIRPLYPILMWYDKRCASICNEFSDETLQQIYLTCGMRLTPVSSAPKILWLKRNHPDIYEKAYKLIGIHDYLLYTLTKQLVTDASCACRSALMDIRSFDWSEDLLSIFGIDRWKLCGILRPGSVVGNLAEDFAAQTGLPAVPVISAGGDQQCCLLGQGTPEAGIVSVNSGSASYLSIPVAVPALDEGMEVNLSAYYGAYPWVLEAANMGSGTIYQWFNRNFYHGGTDTKDTTAIDKEVAEQPPGCNGLICYSDFAGRGCPGTNPNARGMFFGAGLQHTRGSFARAVLEGICFDICDCIRYMQSLGVEIRGIQSAGGLTNFPVFNHILADISGMRVDVSTCTETTAIGAFRAALAAVCAKAPAIPLCYGPVLHFEPSAENHSLYSELWAERQRHR